MVNEKQELKRVIFALGLDNAAKEVKDLHERGQEKREKAARGKAFEIMKEVVLSMKQRRAINGFIPDCSVLEVRMSPRLREEIEKVCELMGFTYSHNEGMISLKEEKTKEC